MEHPQDGLVLLLVPVNYEVWWLQPWNARFERTKLERNWAQACFAGEFLRGKHHRCSLAFLCRMTV